MNTMEREAQVPVSEKITVLIVDDSQVQRNLIRTALAGEPDIEVVSQANNGRLALPRVRHYQPDLILLDQEMPEMTGLEFLEEIRRDHAKTGVIMYAGNTRESARLTLRALEMGALDFIAKPEMGTGHSNPLDYIRSVLVPRIRELGTRGRKKNAESAPAGSPTLPSPRALSEPAEICAIGISTGGPVALRKLFSLLPGRLNASLLIVQHMPPIFTGFLAETLNALNGLRVVEATDGMRIEKGCAYIAPGGAHMVLESGGQVLHIIDTDPELNCKPSVNVLFRSVAREFGPRALGIVMTGMGSDGCAGLREMKRAGARTLGQNQESCLIFGMPGAAAREGLLDEELSVEELALRIQTTFGAKR